MCPRDTPAPPEVYPGHSLPPPRPKCLLSLPSRRALVVPMPSAEICIDCGRTVDSVKSSRCARCWPAFAERKRKREAAQTREKSAKRVAYHSITKTNRWKRLSEQTRKRDGGCVRCGTTQRLEVHHVVPVLVDPDLAFDPSNLITLCRACHAREERRVA